MAKHHDDLVQVGSSIRTTVSDGTISTNTGDLTLTPNGDLVLTAGKNFGLGETTPLGVLHIKDDDAGGALPVANYDRLVIEDDSTPNLTLFSGTSGTATIAFMDTGALAGAITYLHTSDVMNFRTGGDTRASINSDGYLAIGGGGTTEGWIHCKYGPTTSDLLDINQTASLVCGQSSGVNRGYIKLYGKTAGKYTVLQTTLANCHLDTDDNSGAVYTQWYSQGDTILNGQGGFVGIGETAPLSLLHIKSGDCGAISPASTADELIVESSGNTGITIYSQTGNTCDVAFGNQNDDWCGGIRYNNDATGTSQWLGFYVNNDWRVLVDGNGKVGIGTTSPDGTLHVHEGSAGAVTANSYSTLVLETDQDWNYLSFLSPDAKEQGIIFGDASDNAMGGVKYDHNVNDLSFYTNATGDFSGYKWMTIDSSGAVFMPNVYADDINGSTYRDLLIKNDGQLGYDSSALRYKTNINPLNNTDWIHSLNPISFEYKQKDDDGKYTEEPNGKREEGFIADEVSQLNPQYAFYNDDGSVEGIHYRKLVVPAIVEIQKLRTEIDELRAELATLKGA